MPRWIIKLMVIGLLLLGVHLARTEPSMAPYIDPIFELFEPEKITYQPGVLIPFTPQQLPVRLAAWNVGEVTLQPVARLVMVARVLAKERYWLGDNADLVPYDIVFGWQSFSDQKMVDRIDFTQGLRGYQYHYDTAAITPRAVSTQTANMHLIPENEAIRSQIDNLVVGDIVSIDGVLVNVTNAQKGINWKSSVKRDDLGDESGEIVFIKRLSVISQNYPRVTAK